MLKKEFLIQKKSAQISFEECYMLQILLERGMSFKECLDVLQKDPAHSLFAELKNKISKGESIQELMEQILDKKVSKTFCFFIQFLSMEKSLKCSLSLAYFETSMKKEMAKKCIYPALMLFLAVILSLIFNLFFFPIMLDLMESFKSETKELILIAWVLKMIAGILILLGILVGMTVLICLQKSRIASVYEFLCSHFKMPFLRRLFSYFYVCYFLELLRVGCSTQQGIQLMKNTKDHPIINLYSYRIHELLLMGKSIKEAFLLEGFDPLLSQFIAIGAYSSKMEEMLRNYCELVKRELEKKMHRMTAMIQCATYGLIGMILIFIYQILLSPMNIITQI